MAFASCNSLTSIEIPKSIQKTTMVHYGWDDYYGIFKDSNNLKTITFEEGITKIPAGIFANNGGIETITIPNTIITIGNNAFENCTNLKSINFSKNLEKIEGSAFFGNISLKEFNMPDTVTIIENNAFSNCGILKNAYISKKLTTLGNNVFNGCSNDLTLISEKYSNATKVFIDKDLNFEFSNDKYIDDENKVINKNESEYYLNLNTMANGYISSKIKYGIKENAFNEIQDKKIIVKIPKEMDLHTSGIYIDSKLVTNYQIIDGKIQIPVEKRTGTIKLCFDVLENTYIRTYAELSYTKNNESCSEVFEVILEENDALSITGPEESNDGTVNVQGVGPKGQDITISLEGQEDITVKTSDTTGRYTANVKINTTYNYYTSKITAKTIDESGKEITAYTTIRYNERTPSIKSFIMKYSDHSDRQIDLVEYQNNRTPINYYPNVAPGFELTFENAEKIDKVYVTSTRDGKKKKLEATYNAQKGVYEAEGFFDANNKSSYVPGIISYEYTLKREEPESEENFNIENNILYKATKEAKENDYLQIKPVEVTAADTKGTQILDNANINYGSVTTKAYEMSYGEAGLDKLTENPIYKSVELYVTEIANIPDANKDLLLSEFDALSTAATFTKYFTKDGKLAFNVDFSDPYSVTSFVYDISSNKLITYTLQASDYSGLAAAGEFFGCLNEISPMFKVAKDYFEIDYKNDDLTKRILESDMSAEGKQTALECAERLDTVRKIFFVFSTVALLAEQEIPIIAVYREAGEIIFGTMFDLAENIMLDENSPVIEAIAYVTRGIFYPVRWIIDPSGYVYDLETGNRIENVKCTIYYKENENSQATFWNAGEYEQLNPLYTDEDGKYAWDVPEGLWQVKYEKEGYVTKYSDWLVVPPPQTDVNIAMVKEGTIVAHTHTWDNGTITKQATCKETGVKTYKCTECEETKTETIDKLAHTYKLEITKATLSKNGSIVKKCSVCGAVDSTTAIPYPKTITLSKTSFIYNKKVQKPSITVIGSDGKTISTSNYTVSYSNTNSKKVGRYKVTITFKGNYTGTKTFTYDIKPKGTSLKKLTKGKKQFKAEWKAQKTETTGYEIQYATNNKFTSGKKTVNVKSNKTTSKTVKSLKKNKKYYVRIRTYKTVKIDGKNVKMYSGWSKVLNIKTK